MNYSKINNRLPFLHLAANKDIIREHNQYIQVKNFDEPGAYGPAGIYATATNNYTLVYCNLSDHIGDLENVPGHEILIKADQYKKMTGPKVEFLDFAQPGQIITRNRAGQQLDAVPYITADQGPKYPNWPTVLPTDEPEPTEMISVDPKKLAKVCDIMNAGPLVFEFRGPTRVIIARYLEANKHGAVKTLMMPLYFPKN